MTDRMSISGPVSVEADGPARVALELANKIGSIEANEQKRDREYWLRLYAQCKMIVDNPNYLDEALKLTQRG